ncbi:MAG: helix-turn-helix domain-containing protein [Desulfomonilaceae bacterium]
MTELMTVKQAAQRLEYSSATIRRWIKERKLDHVKFSERGIRIPREAIERLMEIGRQPAERSNQPTMKPAALATNNPASSGTNPN